MIYSLELEQRLLAGLIKYPDVYGEIANFINDRDFCSDQNKITKTIFCALKGFCENGESVDNVILSEKIKNLGISFPQDIEIGDYIYSLGLQKISRNQVIQVAKELKKYTVRREIYEASQKTAIAVKKLDPSSSFSEIIQVADENFNQKIDLFDASENSFDNIFDEMEDYIEELGNNPKDDEGMMGPWDIVNDLYGSLLRAGNITVIIARSAVGKMQPLYSKVLTPEGFKTMGDMTVGSKVLTPNGEVANVIATFDHFDKDVYRVHFEDGRFTDCGLEHLWKIWARDNKGNYNWQIVDTKEILQNHLSKKTKKAYVQLVGKINLSDKDYVLHPYIVGCLIGDGSLTQGFTIESADIELVDRILKLLPSDCFYKKREQKGSKSDAYKFYTKLGSRDKNYLLHELVDLGLYKKRSWEKFIPSIYLNGSYDQRLELLKGLMDTDGTISKRFFKGSAFSSGFEYNTCSEQLAENVRDLVISLGGIAKIKTKKSFYKNKNNEKVICRLCYRVKINFKDPSIAFQIKRKKDLCVKKRIDNVKLKISKIEKLSQKNDCRCIAIDHPDSLYVTDDYIVTHNTNLALNYTTKVAQKYNVPVLHFDNGEMSKKEIMIRQCAAISGVPSFLLETGKWRQAGDEIVKKVRSTWPKIKGLKFYYYSVGGYDTEKMVNLLKRFYYSKVGRGNKMIFSFDYIKPNDEIGKQEWQAIGSMVNRFKKCIQEEIIFDKEPVISMFTSAQSNRFGISTNKHSSDVQDHEGITGGSDRIIHYCTHAFILRKKTLDELSNERQKFGTHLLINVKPRHLGRNFERALNPVKMPNGEIVSNRIHLKQEGFDFQCMGDQNDLVDMLELQDSLPDGVNVDDVPDGLI